jgi:hypothetical protein
MLDRQRGGLAAGVASVAGATPSTRIASLKPATRSVMVKAGPEVMALTSWLKRPNPGASICRL